MLEQIGQGGLALSSGIPWPDHRHAQRACTDWSHRSDDGGRLRVDWFATALANAGVDYCTRRHALADVALRHSRRGRIIEWPCPDGWFELEMTDARSGFAGRARLARFASASPRLGHSVTVPPRQRSLAKPVPHGSCDWLAQTTMPRVSPLRCSGYTSSTDRSSRKKGGRTCEPREIPAAGPGFTSVHDGRNHIRARCHLRHGRASHSAQLFRFGRCQCRPRASSQVAGAACHRQPSPRAHLQVRP